MADADITFYFPGQFNTIHLWHHDVRNDQLRMICNDRFQCLKTISCCVDSVMLTQAILQKPKQIMVIFNNQ